MIAILIFLYLLFAFSLFVATLVFLPSFSSTRYGRLFISTKTYIIYSYIPYASFVTFLRIIPEERQQRDKNESKYWETRQSETSDVIFVCCEGAAVLVHKILYYCFFVYIHRHTSAKLSSHWALGQFYGRGSYSFLPSPYSTKR